MQSIILIVPRGGGLTLAERVTGDGESKMSSNSKKFGEQLVADHFRGREEKIKDKFLRRQEWLAIV